MLRTGIRKVCVVSDCLRVAACCAAFDCAGKCQTTPPHTTTTNITLRAKTIAITTHNTQNARELAFKTSTTKQSSAMHRWS